MKKHRDATTITPPPRPDLDLLNAAGWLALDAEELGRLVMRLYSAWESDDFSASMRDAVAAWPDHVHWQTEFLDRLFGRDRERFFGDLGPDEARHAVLAAAWLLRECARQMVAAATDLEAEFAAPSPELS